jgi:hypothetical protein
MNVIRQIIKEFIGLFIDDGSLALFSLLLVAAAVALVKFTAAPPLVSGLLVFAGCLAILTESVHRAARRR